MITDDDKSFLASFEQCSLGAKCWNHAAHIRIGWIILNEEPTFESALHRIRNGIQRFNSTNNSIGYHETITVAFARLINAKRLPTDTWTTFSEKNRDLFDKACLSRYYSSVILKSDQARYHFLEPDCQPL